MPSAVEIEVPAWLSVLINSVNLVRFIIFYFGKLTTGVSCNIVIL